MARAGAADREIARALGRGVETVRAWRARLGLAGAVRRARPWTATEEERLRQAWLACQRVADIAVDLSRPEWSVAAKARMLGLPRRRRAFVDGAPRLFLVAGRLAKPKTRPCLCCGRAFASEGKGNRLCAGCKRNQSGIDATEYGFAARGGLRRAA